MIEKQRLINRQALAVFNFWLKSQQKDKQIGQLTIGDFIEMCGFLKQLEEVRNDAN